MLPVVVLLAGEPSSSGPWLLNSGPAECKIDGDLVLLGNRAIQTTWRTGPAGVELVRIENRWTGARFATDAPAFQCQRRSASAIDAWERIGPPRIVPLTAEIHASRRADQSPGCSVEVDYRTPDGLSCAWHAVLRDGSNYVRQVITLRAADREIDLEEIALLDARLPGVCVRGTCLGSPVVAGDLFAGFEHPMSQSGVTEERAQCVVHRKLPLRQNQSVEYSGVIGVAPTGQMRRAFLAYVERERSHPYRPFLHYNSWYDLGMVTPFDEQQCVDVIRVYGRELVENRGVKIDSFLFDDGWDNCDSMWEFHAGFPRGFLPLKEEAAKIGAAPGVWLSPWGGYGKRREKRLAFGKAHGFEVDSQGFALSGPKYYARFHEVTLEFVTKYGIGHFKLDGTGSPDKTYPGSAFDSDFDAAIQLIGDLRAARADLFVNLTTGTWPSPFWLRHVDSTWRGGADHSFTGVGSDRQRWITYRDAETYAGVVRRGPLYPINALMLHGIIYAPHAHKLDSDPNEDFRDEVRSYFGSGTQLQELYVSPKLLKKENWDDIAESAQWSRRNSDVLVDTHWVGGDPGKLEVYGWAAWSPRMGILVLRNPSDRAQAFSVDLDSIFELPDAYQGAFTARSPYRSDASRPAIEFAPHRSRALDLAPFEVRVLECSPRRS